jgi:hypothetical protein
MDSQLTEDRAALRLRTDGRVAMAMPELAVAIGADVSELEHRLRRDPRFLVLDRACSLPGLDLWDTRHRRIYAAVLHDLDEPPLVVLRDPGASAPPGVADILRRTVLDLADAPHASSLASAAERSRAALEIVTPTAGTARSTTRPPGPPSRP